MAKKKLRIEMPRGDGDSRTLIHMIGGFLQQADILRRQAYEGDMDQAIVAGMVGIGALDHRARQSDFRENFGDFQKIVGVEGQRGTNAYSIAEATGIPRETVRRKLKELLAKGIVVEKERGRYVMAPGWLQRPENLAALDQTIRRFLQLMNEAVALGVVQAVETKE